MTALLAHETFRKMENTPIIFIAVIAGHCLGGGFELALACDLRFAAEGSYQIGLPEVNLGLFPGSGGTQRLPTPGRLSKGIDLIANATTMKPAEAKDLGLVDRCSRRRRVSRRRDRVRGEAGGRTERRDRPRQARDPQGFNAPLDLGLAIEREAISRVFVSDDAEEGIKAFGEKRKAEF